MSIESQQEPRKCKICHKEMKLIGKFRSHARLGYCDDCHVGVKKKRCSNCKTEKPTTKFGRNGARLKSQCKDCLSEKQKKRNHKKAKVKKPLKVDNALVNEMVTMKW